MTVARDILKKKFDVVSIIGDGAISAGMAFEGLNNIGHLNKNSLIILNDNEMSIAKPVGAMSNYLVKLLSSKTYINVKDAIKKFTSNLPPEVENFAKKTEEYLKGYITGNTLFEELGLNYIGPIDGHNVVLLADLFRKFKDKELTGPIFLHLVTEKGKGYAPAEQSSDKFHGVSSFDISSGTQKKSKETTYTKVVGETLLKIGKLDSKVVAITAAMPGGTGITDFQNKFPDRCFDVGIAEQHAVTFAAGLSTEGIKPYAAIYSTFLQRAYDQVVHDVAIQSLPVRFLIDRSGYVGADGATHSGSFDLTYLTCLPNFIVMAPSNGNDLKDMIYTSLFINKNPSAIRYPRDTVVNYNEKSKFKKIPIGKSNTIQKGNKIALLNLGNRLSTVREVSKLLEENYKIKPSIIDMRFAKPIDISILKSLLKNHDCFVTIEENSIGGFSAQVNHFFLELKKTPKIVNCFMPDLFIDQSDIQDQYKMAKLDSDSIYNKIVKKFLS